MIGKTISHYRILEKLGEGGMGVVFKAHDTRLDRTVALKFLPPHALDREPDKARFVREAKAAASLHHPNICTIHEIDEHEGQLFIAMAFVEGENLRDRIAAGSLAIHDAIDIVMQIASGLQAAHEKGIVHRDVKPANIMLDSSGRPLLMDFGLAQRKDTTRLTRTGTTLGTFAYMSPEQLSSEDIDRRSDIWSLGVVLYELVTGCLSFKGDLEPALMYSILNADPDPVTLHRPEAPSGLDGILARALEKRPEDRYQDTESLRVDLEELRNDPEAFPAGIPVRKKQFRKRLALVIGGLLVATAAASVFVIPRLVTEPQALSSLAVLTFTNLSGDPEQDVYAAGIHAELISTLGKIDNLVVLGRRSVLKYADSDMGPQEIAAELGVAVLMEGSVSLVDDRIHIAAELVKASTGQILWTDNFEGSLSDAMNINRRIALAVANGLNARLTPELQQERTSQIDPEAYRLYLKFQANWSSGEALDTLMKVVEIDSTFPEAWVALSWRASFSAQYGHVPKEEGYELARTSAEKALALDPTLSQAHMAMASIYWQQDWDWEKSLEAVERAAALNPMGGFVRHGQAGLLFPAGRIKEGVALYEEIITLYPLNPDFRQRLGWHLLNIGRFELATEHLERNLELFPDHYFSNMLLAASYAAMGKFEKAVAHRKQMEQMYEGLRVDSDGDGVPEKGIGPRYGRGGGSGMLAKAYANTVARGELVELMAEAKTSYRAEPSGQNAWLVAFYLIPLGEDEEASEWLAISAEAIRENVKAGTSRAAEKVFNQAYLYSSAGDKDQAFEWLDLAFELRAAGLVDLYRRFYRFAELWDDPRYEELMRRRGFPSEVIASLRP